MFKQIVFILALTTLVRSQSDIQQCSTAVRTLISQVKAAQGIKQKVKTFFRNAGKVRKACKNVMDHIKGDCATHVRADVQTIRQDFVNIIKSKNKIEALRKFLDDAKKLTDDIKQYCPHQ